MNWKFLSFMVLAFAAIAFYYYKSQVKEIEVKAYTLAKGEVKATVSNTRVGTVKACRRAYLAPATGGEVAALHVREGDHVKQDQLLLEVWNKDLKAEIALQSAQVKVNRASAKQACDKAAGNEREAARLKRLQKSNQYVSVDQVDKASTAAKAQRAFCQASLENIEVSKAKLQLSQAMLEKTQVIAPFDGTVAEINAELGEFVTPSPPGIPTLPAIDLLDVSCLYVSAPIDEVDADLIKKGMKACVSLDAFEGQRCSGKVSRIAPYVQEKEKQARTVEVEVIMTDPKDLNELLPGYSADIEIQLAQKSQALRLPAEAITEGNHVLLINQDNILEDREFKPGLKNWNFTEVLSGLEEGDRVVTSLGQEGVNKGARVIVRND